MFDAIANLLEFAAVKLRRFGRALSYWHKLGYTWNAAWRAAGYR
jgi:hypothetical protein